jgi:stage V sporulation protein SpoVS
MDKMYKFATVASNICFTVAAIAIAVGYTNEGLVWIVVGLAWMTVQIDRKGN